MKHVFKEVGTLDQKAYQTYHLSEEILMEHAALGMLQAIEELDGIRKITLVCGAGNNGADGIALGRLLLMKEYEVSLFLPFGAKSQMAKLQLERFLSLGGKTADTMEEADLIVDALFGSGLNKALDSTTSALIDTMNRMNGFKLACDIPSGLFANGQYDLAFRADLTVSMGALKLAMFYDTSKDLCGKIVNADLGLPYDKYIGETDYRLLELSDMRLPIRTLQHSHKGTYGHVAVLEGTMPGAPTMTALSALEFGAGLATIVGYENHDYPYALMHASHIPSTANVLALGMGMGQSYADHDLLEMCQGISLVIDADMFSKPYIGDLLKLGTPTVLTPHPKEFATLFKNLYGEPLTVEIVLEKKFELTERFSRDYKDVVLLLKGTQTLIAQNGQVFISSMGTPALAKGGSGDILAGMIAALLAQGYDALEAAISGCIAHSLAANNLDVANYALTPEKLIAEIGKLGK